MSLKGRYKVMGSCSRAEKQATPVLQDQEGKWGTRELVKLEHGESVTEYGVRPQSRYPRCYDLELVESRITHPKSMPNRVR